VLTLALGVVVLPVAGVVGAQPDDPRRARPQANDRFVFAGGNGKGRVITSAEVAPVGPPLTAFPMDPATRVVRDESRLNQVLLVRLRPNDLTGDTRARAAEGIVAYSAVCTHTGCDSWDWQPASSTIKCPCHFSEFDLKDGARVLNGPATRRLPALPLKIVDGNLAVAKPFTARVGVIPS